MSHRFYGKSLLVEAENKRLLVMSDLHLGFEESLRSSGVFVPTNLVAETRKELEYMLAHIKPIDEIIILGDLKHMFGFAMRREGREVFDILDLMLECCARLILIRGNHDPGIEFIAQQRNLEVHDVYRVGSYAFTHGDRDFDVLYEKEIHTWVVGHAHPAISLHEGAKEERYKCFLEGMYKGKKVIVLPSWISVNEGIDVRCDDLGLAWPLDTWKMHVWVVGEGINVLNFGLLKNIP